MEAIIIYVELCVAFDRKIGKRKLQEVIGKIKVIPEIDMDMLLLDIGEIAAIFDDYELIKQKTEIVLNELLNM